MYRSRIDRASDQLVERAFLESAFVESTFLERTLVESESAFTADSRPPNRSRTNGFGVAITYGNAE